MVDAWPDYLLRRAIQPPHAAAPIVAGSTAVVSFGDPLRPKVATLGINPSAREFLDGHGALLAGGRRRLATLDSLGVRSYDELNEKHAQQIVDDCASYFHRNPYKNWFGRLDPLLKLGLGVSYFDDTACHLDLLQWATTYWKELDGRTRTMLLESDKEFLIEQLHNESYSVVLVNGRTALNQVQDAGIVRWEPIERLTDPPTTDIYRANKGDVTLIAWSCNVPNQQGASRHVPAISELLRREARGLIS